MPERPSLDKHLDSKTFREFYYLKEELVDFCRKYGLPVSGGKIEITDRIAWFLDTGEIRTALPVKKRVTAVSVITKIQELKGILFVLKNTERFLRSILEMVFLFMLHFKNG